MSPRIIAYYLPQFHPVKENDEWWGKGFTEWTNVARAKSLFKGHKQPKIPTELGFYDLRIPEVRESQASLARSYGIEGFCYWHYWFGNGKKLLEKPIQEVLASKAPDFPFCFAWANKTWGGLPYGDGFDRTLIEQVYPGEEDYLAHFEYALPFFKDDRYIKVGNKPVFQVNSPIDMPDPNRFTFLWNEWAKANGFSGIYFIAHELPGFDHSKYGYDALSFVTPLHLFNRYKETAVEKFVRKLKFRLMGNSPRLFHYDRVVEASNYADLPKEAAHYIPVAIPNWDHTPRSKKMGNIILNPNAILFKQNLSNCSQLIKDYDSNEQFIFIKSWNEWAEGNYLEPDEEFGRSNLEAVRNFLSEIR
jgi:hypothetical protein